MHKLINLTPHDMVLCRPEGIPFMTVPASGLVARVNTVNRLADEYGFLPVVTYTQEVGEVVGLPAGNGTEIYVVSTQVRLSCPDRPDIVSPGELVRDDKGEVVGCKSLIVNDCPVWK